MKEASILKQALLILFVLNILIFGRTQSYASLATGIDIEAGKFRLYVTMSPSGEEYTDDGILYFQNSSGLLFDLIAFFQEHYDDLSNVEKYYWVDISPDISEISIDNQLKKENEEGGAVRIIRFKELTTELLKKEICALLPVKECKLSKYERTFFYKGPETKGKQLRDKILFGSFPSDSTPKNYVLRIPKGEEREFKKITINRKNVSKYFGKLELW